jgi:hypothetical protein
LITEKYFYSFVVMFLLSVYFYLVPVLASLVLFRILKVKGGFFFFSPPGARIQIRIHREAALQHECLDSLRYPFAIEKFTTELDPGQNTATFYTLSEILYSVTVLDLDPVFRSGSSSIQVGFFFAEGAPQ